eukprot:9977052-Karenia_brevis.AAC.1
MIRAFQAMLPFVSAEAAVQSFNWLLHQLTFSHWVRTCDESFGGHAPPEVFDTYSSACENASDLTVAASLFETDSNSQDLSRKNLSFLAFSPPEPPFPVGGHAESLPVTGLVENGPLCDQSHDRHVDMLFPKTYDVLVEKSLTTGSWQTIGSGSSARMHSDSEERIGNVTSKYYSKTSFQALMEDGCDCQIQSEQSENIAYAEQSVALPFDANNEDFSALDGNVGLKIKGLNKNNMPRLGDTM